MAVSSGKQNPPLLLLTSGWRVYLSGLLSCLVFFVAEWKQFFNQGRYWWPDIWLQIFFLKGQLSCRVWGRTVVCLSREPLRCMPSLCLYSWRLFESLRLWFGRERGLIFWHIAQGRCSSTEKGWLPLHLHKNLQNIIYIGNTYTGLKKFKQHKMVYDKKCLLHINCG